MDKRAIIAVVLVQTIVAVSSLKCYECINCQKVTSEQLLECGGDLITTVRPSAASSPSTIANVTTTPPTTNTSTINTTTTEPTTTLSTTTTTTSRPSTTLSNNGTISPTITPPINSSNQTLLKYSSRRKRDIPLIRAESEQRRAGVTVTYNCYKATVKYNETYNIVYRGCAKKTDQGLTICDNLPAQVKACTTCETDRCNNAFTKQLPFFTIVIMLSLSLIN